MIKCHFCQNNIQGDNIWSDWTNCPHCVYLDPNLIGVYTNLDGWNFILIWRNNGRQIRFKWYSQYNLGEFSFMDGVNFKIMDLEIKHLPQGDIKQVINKLNIYLTFS